MKKKQKKSDLISQIRHNLPELILVLVIIFTLVFEITFAVGPSFYGDDNAYLSLAYQALKGQFAENGYIFSVRILNIFPITFFYALLGINRVGAAAWAITAFVGCIILAFYTAKELYSRYAGAIAAFLLSLFPIFTTLSETPTPNVPVAFFAGLVMFGILKGERKRSKWWYFVAGASAIAALLVMTEGAVVIAIAFIYLLIEVVRKKIRIGRRSLYFVYGFLAASAVVMVYNYVSAKDPFITVTLNYNYYTPTQTIARQAPDQFTNTTISLPFVRSFSVYTNREDLSFYYRVMFPYALAVLTPTRLYQDVFTPSYNYTAFYFIAFAIAAYYLIVEKEKRSYFVMMWFLLTFLYLEIGPENISLNPLQYLFLHRLERYLTLVGIPTVVVMAMAMARFVEKSRKERRLIPPIVVGSALIFLTVSSLTLTYAMDAYNIYPAYDIAQIGAYLSKLPNSTIIYFQTGDSSLAFYIQYNNLTRMKAYDGISNCSNISVHSYVVIPKFAHFSNINYVPNPEKYCPGWQLVLYPQSGLNLSQQIKGTGVYQILSTKLYYVASNGTSANTPH